MDSLILRKLVIPVLMATGLLLFAGASAADPVAPSIPGLEPVTFTQMKTSDLRKAYPVLNVDLPNNTEYDIPDPTVSSVVVVRIQSPNIRSLLFIYFKSAAFCPAHLGCPLTIYADMGNGYVLINAERLTTLPVYLFHGIDIVMCNIQNERVATRIPHFAPEWFSVRRDSITNRFDLESNGLFNSNPALPCKLS